MATHAPITGARTRAPSKVVSFPADPVARMRLQLNRCHTGRMLDRWTADLRKLRTALDEPTYAGLVARGAARKFRLSMAGAA